MAYFQVRTDLALEARESIEDADGSLRGVIVEEYDCRDANVHVTSVRITSKNAAKAMGKPMGTYITLEAPNLCEMGESAGVGEQHTQIAEEISRHLRTLLPENLPEASILVVGLGNRDVTADALGPQVVDNLCITRHMILAYGSAAYHKEEQTLISSIVPGVMAKTGMETAEIIKGTVRETSPHAVIVVDALAARSTRRLNRTIQITNTGIHPGSGVGNHRGAITQEVLGVPVIAIGVPTVVDAATIVNDALKRMYQELKETTLLKIRESLAMAELNNMYVTAKDIDATIRRLSYTLSEALNVTFGMGEA